MTARYTSRGQFANMLERRAKELEELAKRIAETDAADEASECVGDAVIELRAAVKWLRDPVRS